MFHKVLLYYDPAFNISSIEKPNRLLWGSHVFYFWQGTSRDSNFEDEKKLMKYWEIYIEK